MKNVVAPRQAVPGALAAAQARADKERASRAAFRRGELGLDRYGLRSAAGHMADIEHPTGHLEVEVELDTSGGPPRVARAGVVRTARKLFDGTVYPAPVSR